MIDEQLQRHPGSAAQVRAARLAVAMAGLCTEIALAGCQRDSLTPSPSLAFDMFAGGRFDDAKLARRGWRRGKTQLSG